MHEVADEQKGSFLLLFENLFSRDYAVGAIDEVEKLQLHVNKLMGYLFDYRQLREVATEE